jgi:SnoaL-like domain
VTGPVRGAGRQLGGGYPTGSARDTGRAMSSGQIVRKPLRVRERSSRTLGERLSLRLPWLVNASARLIGRLPPSSRLRQAVMWRGARQRMEAFNRRDIDASLIGATPEFEFRPAREFVDMGFMEPCYRGPAGFRQYMAAWTDVWGADLRTEPTDMVDLGDRIVLLANLPTTGTASRVPVTGKIATVSTLDHGRVSGVDMYLDHAEALGAVGLRE